MDFCFISKTGILVTIFSCFLDCTGRRHPLSEKKVMHYMYQLCKSLDHMHRYARGDLEAFRLIKYLHYHSLENAVWKDVNEVQLILSFFSCWMQKWNISQRCKTRKYISKGKNFYMQIDIRMKTEYKNFSLDMLSVPVDVMFVIFFFPFQFGEKNC